MSEWEFAPLADVLEFREGPGIMAADFRSSGVPLIRLAGLRRDGSLLSGCNYLDPEMVDRRWSQFRLRRDDVLLSTSASLGEVAIVDESAVGAIPYTGLIGFRPKDDRVAASFIPLMLREKSFKDQIEAMGVGSVMKHFGPTHLRSMTVTLPPRLEQQAIAEVLGALDNKIAANIMLVSATRRYALAIARVSTAKTSLGDVVFHRSRQIQPATLSEPVVDLFSLPAFDSGSGPERVSPDEIKSGKFLIEGSALLVSKLNPRIPRIWPIDEVGSSVPKLASTEFVVLEPFACTPDVLWALLSQPEFTSALEGQVAGTSGSHQRVRPADLLSTRIPDPRRISPQLHADINDVLAPVSSLLKENRTLAATRDALLPQLMSGKLRVRDAERIAQEAGV